jgi:transglutaminase-like putative cysteine protease
MSGRLRHLFSKDQPRCAMDGWIFRICLAASLFVTTLTSLSWLDLSVGQALVPWLLFALPWIGPILNRWLALQEEIFTLCNQAGKILPVVVIFVAVSENPQPYLLIFLGLLGLVLRDTRQDGHAIFVLFLAPLCTQLAGTRLPEPIYWLALSFGGCLSLSGIFWIHARISRRRIRRGLRRSVSPEEQLPGLIGRAGIASALVLLFLVLAVPSNQVIRNFEIWANWSSDARRHFDYAETITNPKIRNIQDSGLGNQAGSPGTPGNSKGSRTLGSQTRTDRNRAENESKKSPTPQTANANIAQQSRAFPDKLSFDRALGNPQAESSARPRLRIKITAPPSARQRFGPANPLYLINTTYDTFTTEGLAESKLTGAFDYFDTADGSADGWTRLGNPFPLRPSLELSLDYLPLQTSDPNRPNPRTILPRFEPLRSVNLAAVRYRPAGKLTMDFAGPQAMQYRLRCADLDIDPLTWPDDQFDTNHAEDLALPSDLESWQATLREIEQQVEGLDLSEGRVRAVLRHFKSQFQYQLQSELSGPASIHQFLQTKKGYCTYFATAATLALRILGVPARVAAGYRITRWDEKTAQYHSAPATAHAWVEIKVQKWGWVGIDPTPGLQVERAAWEPGAVTALFPDFKPPAEPAPGSELSPELERSEASKAPEFPARTRLNPSKILLAVSTLLMLAAVATTIYLRKTARSHDENVDQKATGMSHPDYSRLLALLSRLGFRKHRTQTPLEFAREVVHQGGLDYLPLVSITMVFYADRFGGFQPSSGELSQRHDFESELRKFMSRE